MREKLHTSPRIEDPDDFYARLIASHGGLSLEQSEKLNSKLILLMANHIGDGAILDELLDAASTINPATNGS